MYLNLPPIVSLYLNLPSIDSLYLNGPPIDSLYLIVPSIVSLYLSLPSIVSLYLNVPSIVSLYLSLPSIVSDSWELRARAYAESGQGKHGVSGHHQELHPTGNHWLQVQSHSAGKSSTSYVTELTIIKQVFEVYALESVKWWRLSSIKVHIRLNTVKCKLSIQVNSSLQYKLAQASNTNKYKP